MAPSSENEDEAKEAEEQMGGASVASAGGALPLATARALIAGAWRGALPWRLTPAGRRRDAALRAACSVPSRAACSMQHAAHSPLQRAERPPLGGAGCGSAAARRYGGAMHLSSTCSARAEKLPLLGCKCVFSPIPYQPRQEARRGRISGPSWEGGCRVVSESRCRLM